MAYDNRALRGVGGWLAFFVIVMAVLSPIRIIATTFQVLNDAPTAATFGGTWPVMRVTIIAVNALAIAGSWFIVWRLNTRPVWQSVRITIAGLWLIGPGIAVLDLFLTSLIGGLPLKVLFAPMIPGMIQPVVSSAIWTAYFLRSERVANTYERPGNGEELAEVFN